MGAARGFLGAGDLFIEVIKGGVAQGLTGPFLVEKFEIKANADIKDKISRGRTTNGQVVASAAIPKPFDLNVTLGEADKVGLAIALLGTISVISQASGTLTAVATAVAKPDIWIPLGKVALTGTPVVTNTAGSTTYVNGTDYLVVGHNVGAGKLAKAAKLGTKQLTEVELLKLVEG